MLSGFLTTGAIIAALFASDAFAQARPALSTDEFLEYSLDALRSKMDSAVEENRQISTRNASIRNRVLFLREETRAMDDELIQLKGKAVDLRNLIRRDAAELKLEEKQLNNLFERKQHLDFEQDLLKKRMETSRLERDMLEQDVNETTFEVRELKGAVTGPAESQLLNYFAEEKVRFLEMIQGYQFRISDYQNKIDMEDLTLAGQLREKETALRENDQLKQQISDWELRLKEEQARAGLLAREHDRQRQNIGESLKAMEQDRDEKREYSKQLTIAIQDMTAVLEDFRSRFSQDEKSLQRQITLLQDENQVLFNYKKMMEDHARLTQVKSDAEHTTLLVTQQQADLGEGKRNIVDDVHQTRERLAQQRNIYASLVRDEERVKKEIADLQARVEQVKKSAAVIREDAFGQKKAALDQTFAEQDARIKKIADETEEAEQELERQKHLLASSQSSFQELKDSLSKATEAFQIAQDQNAAFLQDQKNIQQVNKELILVFQKSIDDARLSQKAMEASRDVIRKKYQAGEYEIQAFEQEQAELKRYLDVLKKENTSLQKRLAELKK